jgi:predicted ribosome quality control (RQC) complex YloA/Tae2 family protein
MSGKALFPSKLRFSVKNIFHTSIPCFISLNFIGNLSYRYVKDKESSVDIYAFVNNKRKDLQDSFVKKIYDLGGGKFIFQIHSPTLKKGSFYIDVKKGICLMDAERGQDAGNLAMFLRKKFMDKKIKAIYQINFDRVVRVDFYNGSSFVMELFRDGNLIVLQDDVIEYALNPREWKNRKIIRNEKYIPPSLVDPLSLKSENKIEILEKSKASIVQTMATRFNLGGELSEEILNRAGIDKNLDAKQCTDLIGQIDEKLNECLRETEDNKGYFYEEEQLVSPIRLTFLNREPDRIMEDFNDSLQMMMETEIKDTPENLRIRRIVENQEKTIDEYRKASETSREIGVIISSHFQTMKKVLQHLKTSDQERLSFDGFVIEVKSKNKAEKSAEITFNENTFKLFYDRSVGENMTSYFDSSKDYLERIEGAKIAMENSIKGIQEQQVKKKKDRPRFWFETYHWFFTPANHLVISGKNTDTNEKVVKKHMGEKDIYIHADMYGAPSTVIRNEDNAEITEEEITEAAAFAVSFSRAWQNGLTSGSAYWVSPLQVSKTPESGQYVRKGSWIVRGKRNYLFNLPLKLSIRMIDYREAKIAMIYPFRENDSDCVTIIPGSRKRDKVAQEIATKLDTDTEEIMRILPSGNADII